MKYLILSVLVVCSTNIVDAQTRDKEKSVFRNIEMLDIGNFIFRPDLWRTKIDTFASNDENKKFKFKWLTNAKKNLRSEGRGFRLLGLETGEVVITSKEGNELKEIAISLYNKGDNGVITNDVFQGFSDAVSMAITMKLGKKPKMIDIKNPVSYNRCSWEVLGTTYQLEKSSSSGGAEFLSLKLISTKDAARGERTASRSSLRSNVVKGRSSTEIYIDNLPMVDQGKKGYCACASAARVYNYYGRSIDQHEMAQLAGSTSAGTSIAEMVDSLKSATSKLNSRVNILYEYPKNISNPNQGRGGISGFKELARDMNSYQQLAKKLKTKSLVINGDSNYPRISSKEFVSYNYFYEQCDPDTFREVMMKKNSFSRYKSKIKEYINQGIPVVWCLQLGLFKEQGIPQLRGGHMRLIIGYNEDKDEIIYSDSWGAGHEKKTMDAGKAFSMTNVLLVLPPTR